MKALFTEIAEYAAQIQAKAEQAAGLAEKHFDLAEDILDFERGTITLPELVNKAKEILE